MEKREETDNRDDYICYMNNSCRGYLTLSDNMRSQTYITKLWTSTLYVLVFLTSKFGIESVEGLTWITKSTLYTKCKGQTAALIWQCEEAATEEIRQLQWRFNRTNLIAYSSKKNGFHVDAQYEGRVERTEEYGILLKNISAKDVGNYSLYPVIAWEESPNIPSIFLNIIDLTKQQWCTCERLAVSPDWTAGRMFSLVADGCILEINSSFCCAKGPAIDCMDNNPQTLCVSINLTESTNQIKHSVILTESTSLRRNPQNLTERTTHGTIVPEDANKSYVVLHTTAPIGVQKGNPETDNALLKLLVANTTMIFTLLLCLTCAIWRIYKRLGRDNYRQKKTQDV